MPTLEELKKMLQDKQTLFEDMKAQCNAVAGQVMLIKDLIAAAEKVQP